MNTTQIKTQVLIIGAGPGGYSAAFNCAELGMDTTIVEYSLNLGGVCLNIGCIPSKALLHISQLIEINKNLITKYSADTVTRDGHIALDIDKICAWKNNIINKLSRNLFSMAKARNIKIIHGVGKFINDRIIQVSHEQVTVNILFDYAIIATGSHPKSLSFMPNDQRIWNSTDALSLKSIPKKLLIIGSGAIGLEMATVYQAFGSKVDLVEACDQIMPILDKDIISIFYKNLQKKNITCLLNTQVNKTHLKTDGVYVTMTNNSNISTEYTNRYDVVLVAIGRTPNSSELHLEKIGVNVNKHGFVVVDRQMRTNISNIFAIGDVVGYPMLAHKSIYEGYIASEIISGKRYFIDSNKIIPSIIYTNPEIAWVGYTEKQAQIQNINYQTVMFPWSALGKAIISDCTTSGMTKLIFNKKTHRIIGGIILGTHASEMIGEITLAIEMGCDVEDITLTMHAHPTLYESIGLAASAYHKSHN